MRRYRMGHVWVVALGVCLVARPMAAQEGGQARPPADEGLTLRLEREVFQWPAFERRNPFRALTGAEVGPHFEDVELRAVVVAEDPSQSVALIALREGADVAEPGDSGDLVQEDDAAPPAQPPSRSMRLRVGDQWGTLRLVSVEPSRVILEVTEFGLSDRRVLPLRRSMGGGIR